MTKAEYTAAIKKSMLSPPGTPIVNEAISRVFADMVSRADFEFMREPIPISTDYVTDQVTYDVDLESVDAVDFLQDKTTTSAVRTVLEGCNRRDFAKIKSGQITSSTGRVWTILGKLQSGLHRFEFYTAPSATDDLFEIYCFRKPDDVSITWMPEKWGGLLKLGVLSQLSGDAKIMGGLSQQYEKGVINMITREPLAKSELPPYRVNDYTADRMEENFDLQ